MWSKVEQWRHVVPAGMPELDGLALGVLVVPVIWILEIHKVVEGRIEGRSEGRIEGGIEGTIAISG